MDKCKICGNYLFKNDDNYLILENVPENTFSFSDKTINLNVIECLSCGCVQLIDVPLSDDYDTVYRSLSVSSDYREEKKNQLEKFFTDFNLKDKKVIEVGCGDGQYLDILKELNIKCEGVEAGLNNYTKCLDKDLLVNYGSVYNIDKKYDSFFSLYYLEHLPDVKSFVFQLYNILKPDGVGLIEVPNYDHIEKNNIWLEFTKDHRLYFRKRTLMYLLLSAGFEIESIDETTGGLCLTAIVRKPKEVSFSSMKNTIEKDETKFYNLVDSLGSDFSVYGAGHYSQLILNNLYSKHKIKPKHIFDSNKDKCGNNLCDVVIEHKDEIVKMKDCRNIIIICGMYNKEVAHMLFKMQLDKKINMESVIEWN